jgi:hypothetical protein
MIGLALWLIHIALWLLSASFVLGAAALVIYGLYCALTAIGRSIFAIRARDVIDIVVRVVIVVGATITLICAGAWLAGGGRFAH